MSRRPDPKDPLADARQKAEEILARMQKAALEDRHAGPGDLHKMMEEQVERIRSSSYDGPPLPTSVWACPRCLKEFGGVDPPAGRKWYCPECAERLGVKPDMELTDALNGLGIFLTKLDSAESIVRLRRRQKDEKAAQKFADALAARIERDEARLMQSIKDRRK